jgi:hypothetical protein
MNPVHREEVFARSIESYARLTQANSDLRKQQVELQELLKDKVRQNAN